MTESTRRAKMITVVNEKGGVGKTQVSVQLAFFLASKESKVLLIDVDATSNATTALTLGQIPDEITKTYRPEGTASTVNLFSDDMQAIPYSVAPYLDLFGSQEPVGKVSGDDAIWAFVDWVDKFAPEYDFIIIDSCPNRGAQMSAAVRAADALLIPCLADIWSYNAAVKILTRLRSSQRRETRVAKVLGIFINKVKRPLSNSAKEVIGIMDSQFGSLFMKHADGRPIALADTVKQTEALSQGRSVIEMAPSSNAALEMAEFIAEIYSRLLNLEAINENYNEFSKGRNF